MTPFFSPPHPRVSSSCTNIVSNARELWKKKVWHRIKPLRHVKFVLRAGRGVLLHCVHTHTRIIVPSLRQASRFNSPLKVEALSGWWGCLWSAWQLRRLSRSFLHINVDFIYNSPLHILIVCSVTHRSWQWRSDIERVRSFAENLTKTRHHAFQFSPCSATTSQVEKEKRKRGGQVQGDGGDGINSVEMTCITQPPGRDPYGRLHSFFLAHRLYWVFFVLCRRTSIRHTHLQLLSLLSSSFTSIRICEPKNEEKFRLVSTVVKFLILLSTCDP